MKVLVWIALLVLFYFYFIKPFLRGLRSKARPVKRDLRNPIRTEHLEEIDYEILDDDDDKTDQKD